MSRLQKSSVTYVNHSRPLFFATIANAHPSNSSACDIMRFVNSSIWLRRLSKVQNHHYAHEGSIMLYQTS